MKQTYAEDFPNPLKPENVVIVYHADKQCLDGFTAACIAHEMFDDKAAYLPASYTDEKRKEKKEELLATFKAKNVFVLDFSYSRAFTEEILKVASSLRILDHHEKNCKGLIDLGCVLFDNQRSGAQLTSDYFFGYATGFFNLKEYTGDYDLWLFKHEQTRPVIAYLEATPQTFKDWKYAGNEIKENLLSVVERGEAILEYKELLVKKIAANAHVASVQDIEISVVNSPILQSEIGNHLAKGKNTFAAVFHAQDGKLHFSLRSDKEIGMDVAEIASVFGGGGHKNAAGFTTTYEELCNL